jgi:hypothetical protein
MANSAKEIDVTKPIEIVNSKYEVLSVVSRNPLIAVMFTSKEALKYGIADKIYARYFYKDGASVSDYPNQLRIRNVPTLPEKEQV